MKTNDSKDQGREALSDEQWYDLASKHANSDWGGDGYLSAIKAVCADYSALATSASALARDEAKELCARCNCWVRPSDDCNLCGSADDAKPVGEASVGLGEFVGYYWIGNDNRQKFCGSYDTINAETAKKAQKVYLAAASSAATVSDAASVAEPVAWIERCDFDDLREQGGVSCVLHIKKGDPNYDEVALYAAPQAATTAGAQDDIAQWQFRVKDLCSPFWTNTTHSDACELSNNPAFELRALKLAASSATAPLTSDSDARYIVIGYGETDHPQAAFVHTRDGLLDAVLGMMYTKPADADAEIREAYRKDLADDDEWSHEGIWRTEFEIGGVVIYDLGYGSAQSTDGEQS